MRCWSLARETANANRRAFAAASRFACIGPNPMLNTQGYFAFPQTIVSNSVAADRFAAASASHSTH